MLTSSPSPTFSAAASASSPPHPFSQSSRSPKNASWRTTPDSRSPRLYPPLSATRCAANLSSSPQNSLSTSSHLPSFEKPKTVDAGTQYTPPDFPPTYRPRAHRSNPVEGTRSSFIAPKRGSKRREASAEAATASPELELRVSPRATCQDEHQRKVGRSSEGVLLSSNSGPSDEGDTSSPKRQRPADPPAKVLPRRYEKCNTKDLGILISDMLMELVRRNDDISLRDDQLTRFHSRAPPGISVSDYLHRLIVHATLSPPLLLSMVYYLDRLCCLYTTFTVNSLTVHRFLITAATVASKGLSDSFWTNSTYARVGGVSTRELALLELEFLGRLQWKIVPRPEVLVDYYRALIERIDGYTIEKELEATGRPGDDKESK